MKKTLYTLFTTLALLFAVAVVNAQVTVYFQVNMDTAKLGEKNVTNPGSCPVAPFNPTVDVVEAMGQEYNNWSGTVESVPCGTPFTPADSVDFVPLSVGSLIYTKVKSVVPTNNTLTYKYRIDHSWDNDELRGVGDGNRHVTLPTGATSVVVYSIFNDSANTVTVGSGIQNPVWATIQKIYPNPSSDQSLVTYLVLNDGNVHVYITDAIGAVVKEVLNARQGLGAQQVNLNTSDLAPGIYQVNVKIGNSAAVQKLSVVR